MYDSIHVQDCIQNSAHEFLIVFCVLDTDSRPTESVRMNCHHFSSGGGERERQHQIDFLNNIIGCGDY